MADPRMYEHGPYRYLTKHGIGPGTLPKDVKLVKWEDLDNYYTAIWTDRFLTTKELKEYDIFPEYIQSPEDIPGFAKRESVFESLTNDDIEKLSVYSLTEDELSHLLGLLELIDDDNKIKAFELVDALFSGKKLVADEEQVEESVKVKQRRVQASESYTLRLLGDI